MTARSPLALLATALLVLLSACAGPTGQSAGPATSAPGTATATPPAPSATTGIAPQHENAPAATTATPPTASSSAEAGVDAQIKDVLGGDPAAYHAVFDRLQKDMAAGNKAGVAALVSYPLDVKVDGHTKKLHNAKELIDNWSQIVTPEVRKAVANQKFSKLFVNQDGIMVGNGQVWISGVCKNDACKHSDVLITAIQQGPK